MRGLDSGCQDGGKGGIPGLSKGSIPVVVPEGSCQRVIFGVRIKILGRITNENAEILSGNLYISV